MYEVSQWFFGDDLSKRISQINNINSGLTQPFSLYQQNNGWYNNSSHSGYSCSSEQKMPIIFQPSRRSLREKGSEPEQQQSLQELKNVSKQARI